MSDNKSITGRYLGLFFLGCFLFSYPVLTIFNLPGCVFGIPLFFFYFFTAWLALIIFIIICGKISNATEHEQTGDNNAKKSH
ncbi:MAG: hypothetical protein L3J69_10390 [Desulfobacula sp.]|nr:hypothetical protein [Desulfobacula sp.]